MFCLLRVKRAHPHTLFIGKLDRVRAKLFGSSYWDLSLKRRALPNKTLVMEIKTVNTFAKVRCNIV